MAKDKKKLMDSKHSRLNLRVRLSEGGSILVSAVALFLLLALLSYSPDDGGWSQISSSNDTTVHNVAGYIGAWFADVMLTVFGYMAYLLPLMLFYSAYLLFKPHLKPTKTPVPLWALRCVGFLMTLMASCCLATLYLTAFLDVLPQSSGGIVGQLISKAINHEFGGLGTIVLLVAVLLAGSTLATGVSWMKVSQSVAKGAAFCLLLSKQFSLYLAYRFKTLTSLALKGLGGLIKRSKPLSKKATPSINVQKAFQEPQIDSHQMAKMLYQPTIEPERLHTTKVIQLKPKKKPSISSSVSSVKKERSNALPDVDVLLLPPVADESKQQSAETLELLSSNVEVKLQDFGVNVKVVAVYPGPVITRFEMELAPGLKVSKITALAKDLARSLSVNSVRVVEVIPGKAVVGLEIPNPHRELVTLREIVESDAYHEQQSPLTLALGKDISGQPEVVNLAKMPHLLVAGTTGSGKSVGVNAMLLSMLYKATPEDLRLILIDPKMLELSIYDGIPHLLTPVVTDMKDAANALKWCVAEMERRYQLMASVGVRNLAGFNRKVQQAAENGNPIVDPFWQGTEDETPPLLEKLPYIVVIIDEFADMIMVVGKKVEELIARIAQKARAAGIHMILATQRPSVDVITGLIKANVPTRIAFQVSSKIDSRTILDQMGAETLLGHGDMLYLAPGTGIPTRVHGAFVSDEEVHEVVKALKQNGEPDYIDDIGTTPINLPGLSLDDEDGESDALYDQAVNIVIESRRASISHLQRRLKIGYNRAARLIETMESRGVVSEMQHNGGREVLVPEQIES